MPPLPAGYYAPDSDEEDGGSRGYGSGYDSWATDAGRPSLRDQEVLVNEEGEVGWGAGRWELLSLVMGRKKCRFIHIDTLVGTACTFLSMASSVLGHPPSLSQGGGESFGEACNVCMLTVEHSLP